MVEVAAQHEVGVAAYCGIRFGTEGAISFAREERKIITSVVGDGEVKVGVTVEISDRN